MGCSYGYVLPILFFLFISVPISIADEALNHSVPAVFVFGDSTVDPGNNNYISTPLKADFLPYGKDLPFHIPTGRFTNGKLVTDFIASYLGLKEFVPPYLDVTLSLQDLITGVSFASASSGYDPLTPQISRVISLQEQLDYFKEYKQRLELVMGKEGMENHVRNAIYIVSAGTNDFVINYFGIPIERRKYSLTDYQNFIIQNTRNFLQGMWDLGARKIGIAGLPPMGCIPAVITLNSDNAITQRDCINSYTQVAIDYNQKLQQELHTMQSSFTDNRTRIVYVDIYQPIIELIGGYEKFGFEEWQRGCCGTGFLEVSFLCNPNSYVCPDASKYIFWDAMHPTEKTYHIVFNTVQGLVDFLANN